MSASRSNVSFDFFALHEIRSFICRNPISAASSFFCDCFVLTVFLRKGVEPCEAMNTTVLPRQQLSNAALDVFVYHLPIFKSNIHNAVVDFFRGMTQRLTFIRKKKALVYIKNQFKKSRIHLFQQYKSLFH